MLPTRLLLRRPSGVYYCRKVVPKPLRPVVNRREIWCSLHTTRRREALGRLREAIADIEDALDRAQRSEPDERGGGQAARSRRRLRHAPRARLPGHRWSGAVLADLRKRLAGLCPASPESDPANGQQPQRISIRGIDLTQALMALLTTQLASPTLATGGLLLPPGAMRSPITLGDLIARFERDKKFRWSGKTMINNRAAHREIKRHFGIHRAIHTITRDEIRSWRDEKLARQPRNGSRRRKPLPKEGSRAATPPETISRKTRNTYLGALASLFNYAVEEQLIPSSPARGLLLPVKGRGTDDESSNRRPYTIDELNRLFSVPQFVELGRYSAKFWLPLICLFTGLRMNEAAQLDVSDIEYVGNVPVIHVRERSVGTTTEGPRKNVKTPAAVRSVPVHPTLERLGLMEHWRNMKARGETKLFPDLRPAASGYYSDRFSQWYARFTRKIGVYSPGAVFHSLRHNFRDALREAGVGREHTRFLGGWAREDTADEYGTGFHIATSYQAIKKIAYPGLRLDHLFTK